jgi:hypothetical protein
MKALTPAVAPLQLPLSQNLGEGVPDAKGRAGVRTWNNQSLRIVTVIQLLPPFT